MIAVVALCLLTPSWRDIVQPDFRDCTFTARAVKGNERELKKISSEFAQSYKFSFMKAKVKEPFMVRLESNVEGTELLYVLNNGRRLYRIPKLGIGKVENVSNAPGKQQTVLDFGILTPSLFETLWDATFVRNDRETGDYVFDLTYKHPRYNDTTRQRIWVDPQKKIVAKRVWFAQDGHEMATFQYVKAQEQDGVWYPTEAIVNNVDGKLAGITSYTNMKINVGLPDTLFKF